MSPVNTPHVGVQNAVIVYLTNAKISPLLNAYERGALFQASKMQRDRLEFIGDGLISACVRLLLLEMFPDDISGNYARIYEVVTSNATFTHIMVAMGLHKLPPNKVYVKGTSSKHAADMLEVMFMTFYQQYGFSELRRWVRKVFRPILLVARESLLDIVAHATITTTTKKRGYDEQDDIPEPATKRQRVEYSRSGTVTTQQAKTNGLPKKPSSKGALDQWKRPSRPAGMPSQGPLPTSVNSREDVGAPIIAEPPASSRASRMGGSFPSHREKPDVRCPGVHKRNSGPNSSSFPPMQSTTTIPAIQRIDRPSTSTRKSKYPLSTSSSERTSLYSPRAAAMTSPRDIQPTGPGFISRDDSGSASYSRNKPTPSSASHVPLSGSSSALSSRPTDCQPGSRAVLPESEFRPLSEFFREMDAAVAPAGICVDVAQARPSGWKATNLKNHWSPGSFVRSSRAYSRSTSSQHSKENIPSI